MGSTIWRWHAHAEGGRSLAHGSLTPSLPDPRRFHNFDPALLNSAEAMPAGVASMSFTTSAQRRRRRNAMATLQDFLRLEQALVRLNEGMLSAREVEEQEREADDRRHRLRQASLLRVPRRRISAQVCKQLQLEQNGTCSICLEDYLAGHDVACMPCDGLHKAHWACLKRWCDVSPSCPVCRWVMPIADRLDAAILNEIMVRGEIELKRLHRSAGGSRINETCRLR
mmetsp:Transcript_35736/g.78521  ORF Transcript_35736/g.78521 Transcript_35736/m.78521 type:complete len:226 (-) Transcript_35736:98-775(-)|eukprot:5176136-Pleurochrysis_carterae.AAC.1